jgi:DNA-binding response OmpR family regulator
MTRHRKTCFLIDDDLDDQEIFALALKQISDKFECNFASNGYEAVLKLKGENPLPDFIFLDLNMPRMNGKECLKELRKMGHLDGVPIIIYSTSSSASDIRETQELGAAAFITKPFSLVELAEKLEAFFQKNGDSAFSENGRSSGHAGKK